MGNRRMADREDPSGAIVRRYVGAREDLRDLFELAEDSASQLDIYIADGEVLVALTNDQIVGHLQLIAAVDGESMEIKNMAVRPQQQGRGIGRALVLAALELARNWGSRRVSVATAAADVGNLRFYQRLGFRMTRVERDAFMPATGYTKPVDIDGITLRDRVWFDLEL